MVNSTCLLSPILYIYDALVAFGGPFRVHTSIQETKGKKMVVEH